MNIPYYKENYNTKNPLKVPIESLIIPEKSLRGGVIGHTIDTSARGGVIQCG